MNIRIEREALDLTFRTLLSCKCPVTDKEEQELFELLSGMNDGEMLDYSRVLKVFKPNANTVFRRLGEFSAWMAPAEADEFVITRDHAIRHFASSFHWHQVVADGLTGAYKKVLFIPSWFMGHMLLPARITEVAGDTVTAVYEYDGGNIELTNLFAPNAYEPKVGEMWGVHFAALLDRITPEEDRLVRMLTDTNPLLVEFRTDVDEIDYKNFERHGDYLGTCQSRYATYYG
ncbi:MAG: hypothetical protein ACYC6C_11145 [Coriobacteriia bacterium]